VTREFHLIRTCTVPTALLLLCGTSAAADAPAVHGTNYQIGYASGDTRVSDGANSNTYGFNGSVSIPLGTYFGASVSADYGRTNFSTSSVTSQSGVSASTPAPRCELNTAAVDAGLFFRNPTLGRIGVGYGAGSVRSHCDATFVATGTSTMETTSSTVNAEYYFSAVTLAATRTRTHIKSTFDLDSSSLSASWYPTPNLRTTITGDGLDYQDTCHFNLEYQPEILDNSTGLFIGYSSRRQTTSTHVIMVGINYYFDKRVDLKTRDREYR
jgi:hypothetical protein